MLLKWLEDKGHLEDYLDDCIRSGLVRVLQGDIGSRLVGGYSQFVSYSSLR